MAITLTPRNAKVGIAAGLGALLSMCCCGGLVVANMDGPTPVKRQPLVDAPATPATTAAAVPDPVPTTPTAAPTPTPTQTTAPVPLLTSPRPAVSPKPPVVRKPSPTPRRTTSRPKPPPPPEEPKPEPAPVFYKNCDAVRAAGADPIRRGQPGYGRHLDRDGDGVGCE